MKVDAQIEAIRDELPWPRIVSRRKMFFSSMELSPEKLLWLHRQLEAAQRRAEQLEKLNDLWTQLKHLEIS